MLLSSFFRAMCVQDPNPRCICRDGFEGDPTLRCYPRDIDATCSCKEVLLTSSGKLNTILDFRNNFDSRNMFLSTIAFLKIL